MSLTRRGFAKAAAGVAFVAGFGGVSGAWAQSADTIKVGVLHSLSGTMAISETTLKDVMLMLIEEQNKKGGLLGKKLEAVVVDPALRGSSAKTAIGAPPAAARRKPVAGPGGDP